MQRLATQKNARGMALQGSVISGQHSVSDPHAPLLSHLTPASVQPAYGIYRAACPIHNYHASIFGIAGLAAAAPRSTSSTARRSALQRREQDASSALGTSSFFRVMLHQVALRYGLHDRGLLRRRRSRGPDGTVHPLPLLSRELFHADTVASVR